MALDTMEVVDQAREKAEKGLLLEVRALLFMRAGKHKNKN